MFRQKEITSKSDNWIKGVVKPASESDNTTKAPDLVEKAPIAVSGITTPTPTSAAHEKVDAKNATQTETKRLIVGRGISLNGQISSCDRLIVEGNVQVDLQDCHTLQVTESGYFKGAAEIAGAEISGHFEGSLTVRDDLVIHAAGRVSGTVRYGRLQIEHGGEINGDFRSMATATPANPAGRES